MISLARPWILLGLLLLPWWWWRLRKLRPVAAVVSEIAPFSKGKAKHWRLRVPPGLRSFSVTMLLIAASGPFRPGDRTVISTSGISIVMAIDVSSSMLAQDFAPDNRLEVAKRQAINFVKGRKDDRIGLVIFAGEALTLVPATLDYHAIIESAKGIQVMQLADGTAIGSGLATAVARLRRLPGKEKVVLLVTDGVNNQGIVDPRTAAQAAQAYGIKVYTVGVGTEGEAPFPTSQGAAGVTYEMMKVEIDEALLQEIAAETGGQYFRATDAEALGRIFKTIDGLERTPIEAVRYVRRAERTFPFVVAALLGLALELLVSMRWVVRIP